MANRTGKDLLLFIINLPNSTKHIWVLTSYWYRFTASQRDECAGGPWCLEHRWWLEATRASTWRIQQPRGQCAATWYISWRSRSCRSTGSPEIAEPTAWESEWEADSIAEVPSWERSWQRQRPPRLASATTSVGVELSAGNRGEDHQFQVIDI